jgi:hypothetical protein
MFGIVNEVSAIFVEITNFLQLAGAGLKIFCCSDRGNEEYKQ